MAATVTLALVALGGYGNSYLRALFEQAEANDVRFVAGIDPAPVGCRYLEQLQAQGIPIYPNLASFYAHSSADLVAIAAPIHLHLPFTQIALAHGAQVLCEKPVAGTIQDVHAMAAAESQAGKPVAIGYQWSYSVAIQALKHDILSGELGRPLRLVTKLLWPRPASYYHRNTWAAKLKAADGSWILDSPVMNATAHYLHNCFYILGKTSETSARPVDVQAELYRANPIENYDTGALRCHTEEGVEIIFLTTHAVPETIGPVLRYEFEQAIVEYRAYEESMVARFRNGRVKDYGSPYTNEMGKIWQVAETVRSGALPACGIAGATPHILATNGAQESMWEITEFPAELIRQGGREEDPLIWVEGLQQAVEACFEQACLPSELGTAPWARSGRLIDLRAYRRFPTFHA